jgi:hypothetical protein
MEANIPVPNSPSPAHPYLEDSSFYKGAISLKDAFGIVQTIIFSIPHFTMYTIRNLVLLAIASLANSQETIGFGPYFSLGPTQSWIREATTTLVLPQAPSPQKDRLALWPGMGTSGGDLIQALAVSFSDPTA